MTELSAWGATVAGMLVGGACGFTVRRARLCSFGAIEDAWMGGDTRRLRIFGLALAVALAGAQSLIGLGLLDPSNATYVQPALPWLSIAIGRPIWTSSGDAPSRISPGFASPSVSFPMT